MHSRHRTASVLAAAALLVVIARAAAFSASASLSPQAAVDELLAADRAFAAAGAGTDAVSALSAMLTDDVVMPVPGGRFAEGREAAVEALRGSAEDARSRINWTPVRGGISADGQHGFTFGYMTLRRPDDSRVPLKYLAYWVKRPEGWRVAAYKRARRAEGEVSLALMPPALPSALVSPSSDGTAIERFRTSLVQAEQAFSDTAQRIGLGPAFALFGSADAINLGGPNDATFVVGAEAIGRAVSGGGPANGSPVSWSADRALVASSGDLGITFGMIRRNAPQRAEQGGGIPFFTIWRRDSPAAPWRYVAE